MAKREKPTVKVTVSYTIESPERIKEGYRLLENYLAEQLKIKLKQKAMTNATTTELKTDINKL